MAKTNGVPVVNTTELDEKGNPIDPYVEPTEEVQEGEVPVVNTIEYDENDNPIDPYAEEMANKQNTPVVLDRQNKQLVPITKVSQSQRLQEMSSSSKNLHQSAEEQQKAARNDNAEPISDAENNMKAETAEDIPVKPENAAQFEAALRAIYAHYALTENPDATHRSNILYYPPAAEQTDVRQDFFKDYFRYMAQEHMEGKYTAVDTYNQIADATVDARKQLIENNPELAEIDTLSMDVARHDTNVQSAFLAKGTTLDACKFYDKDGNEVSIEWDYDNQADYDTKTRALIDAMDHGNLTVKLPDGSDMKMPVVDDGYTDNLAQYDEKMGEIMAYRGEIQDRVQQQIGNPDYQQQNMPEYLKDENYQKAFWDEAQKNQENMRDGYKAAAEQYQSGGYMNVLQANGINVPQEQRQIEQQETKAIEEPQAEESHVIEDKPKTESQRKIDETMQKAQQIEERSRDRQFGDSEMKLEM